MKMRIPTLLIVVFAFIGLVTAVAAALAWPQHTAADTTQPEAPAAPEATAVGTGFTYQGYLANNNVAANGNHDFEFKLFDANAGGVQIGSTVTQGNVQVQNGLFIVELDFGALAFGQNARWLEIRVRPSGGGAYTALSPRQELRPAPYALGLPNVYTDEALNFVGVGRNFRISGNEVFGVRYTGGANVYGGMYVETAHAQGWPFYGYATNGSFRAWTYYDGTSSDWFLYNAGTRLHVPNEGGLRITPNTAPTNSQSLVISGTATIRSSDGIRIYDTADDGIQMGSDPDYPNYGLYIPSPGVSVYGLWPNTAVANGEWALYTADKISASNVLANAYSLVAEVAGTTALEVGDVVAATGMADPLPGSHNALPMVRLADGRQFSGVVGVVTGRMVFDVAPGKEEEGEMSLQSAAGPANPGDYVALAIYGVAEVKLQPGTAVQAGERLTASGAGQVRGLQTRMLDGMVITEGAQSIGIALESAAAGQETVHVFVTLR